MIKFKLFIFLGCVLLGFSLADYAVAPKVNTASQSPLKVLVITGTHDYDQTSFNTMFDSFDKMDFIIKNIGEDPGQLFESVEEFSYNVIVLYNYRQRLSDIHQENFKAILGKRVGLVVIHHAIAGFPEWREFEDIIGATYVLKEETRNGIFYQRPKWKHNVDMKIHVENPNHPVTKGVKDFTIHDEAYKHWIYHEGNDLLLTTNNEHSNHQIAWTRSSLNTNIFYMQLGHGKDSFENEFFRRLLFQGIVWTAGK